MLFRSYISTVLDYAYGVFKRDSHEEFYRNDVTCAALIGHNSNAAPGCGPINYVSFNQTSGVTQRKQNTYVSYRRTCVVPSTNLVHCVILVVILFQRWTMSTAMSDPSTPSEDEDCHPRRGNGGGRCRHRPGDTAYHPRGVGGLHRNHCGSPSQYSPTI